jgi:dissimilatory sulfite reductase (desulfoviridin) alpha/beta subunit
MKWTSEAEAAIKKVPFFVRKRVRDRVEKEAGESGKASVGLAEVKSTQQRYLNKMASEVKGYQLDVCFGPNGCPNRAIASDTLMKKLEDCLEQAQLLSFLKRELGDNLKFHHEFRVTAAECPNACSQPQIKDIGIIGVCEPLITPNPCTGCEACKAACPDDAITVENQCVEIDATRCLACGKCADVCPTGTIARGNTGYKILLGGKLGRHPRLAREVPGIFTGDETIEMVKSCITYYKQNSRGGRRFAEILTEEDFRRLFLSLHLVKEEPCLKK